MEGQKPVAQAWAAVMRDVEVVGKTGYNEAQKYAFRGVDDVVNALGPAMRDHGVFIIPEIIAYDYGAFQAKQGPIPSVRVTVRYRVYGPAGDYFEGTVPGESMDHGDKATAKAMSVAYRTFLLQAASLPTGEPDPDSQTYQPGQPRRDRDQRGGQQHGGLGPVNTSGQQCPECHAPNGKPHRGNCKAARADSVPNPAPPAPAPVEKPAPTPQAQPTQQADWKVVVWKSTQLACEKHGIAMRNERDFRTLIGACPFAWATGLVSPAQIQNQEHLDQFLKWLPSRKPAPAAASAPAATTSEDVFAGIPEASK